MMRPLEIVSMEATSATWSLAWRNSLPGKTYANLMQGLSESLRPLLATSYFAKIANILSLASICLLFMLSPFVGTGINAALALFAFACAMFDRLVNPPAEQDNTALLIPLFLLIGIHVVAVGASPYLMASIKGFSKLVVYWLAFAALMLNLRNRRGLVILLVVLAAAFLESAYGLYQYHIKVAPLALWEDAEATIQLTRVYGSLRNPNLLAGYLLPIIPLAVAGLAAFKNRIYKVFCGMTALMAILCLGFTYSRGAMVGLALEGLVLFVFAAIWLVQTPRLKPWMKWGLLLGALAGVIGLLLFFPGLHDRILSITTTRGHSSNSFRMNVWTAVFAMIRDSWLFGVGVGNKAFMSAYSLYMVSGFEALSAYNIYLEVLVETGIIGILAFGWLLFGALGRCTLMIVRHENRIWAAALLAALLGMMAHGMVDTVFFRPSVQLLFWLILAMVMRLDKGAVS